MGCCWLSSPGATVGLPSHEMKVVATLGSSSSPPHTHSPIPIRLQSEQSCLSNALRLSSVRGVSSTVAPLVKSSSLLDGGARMKGQQAGNDRNGPDKRQELGPENPRPLLSLIPIIRLHHRTSSPSQVKLAMAFSVRDSIFVACPCPATWPRACPVTTATPCICVEQQSIMPPILEPIFERMHRPLSARDISADYLSSQPAPSRRACRCRAGTDSRLSLSCSSRCVRSVSSPPASLVRSRLIDVVR